jgi:hypothetical protein
LEINLHSPYTSSWPVKGQSLRKKKSKYEHNNCCIFYSLLCILFYQCRRKPHTARLSKHERYMEVNSIISLSSQSRLAMRYLSTAVLIRPSIRLTWLCFSSVPTKHARAILHSVHDRLHQNLSQYVTHQSKGTKETTKGIFDASIVKWARMAWGSSLVRGR